MKHTSVLLTALWLVMHSAALASTWYVNGVTGSDNNNCLSSTTACKTIGHAISRAASGDSIRVAAAIYVEQLTIAVSLNITGSGALTTIIDGGGINTVVTVLNANANVGISSVTVRNGYAGRGGGIYNSGILTISSSVISGNRAFSRYSSGGGVDNRGTLTMNNTTVSGNTERGGVSAGLGGGIANGGTLTVNNSTITGNFVSGAFGAGFGGGIGNAGKATVNNSTISGNTATAWGGGIGNEAGNLTINNSTISGNKESYVGGLANYSGVVTIQNSIVANNSAGDCYVRTTIISKGHNLSSDLTCHFTNAGDLNNTNPLLGPLQNNGGPTQTMALPSGSPAIDAGNPNGCTDGMGHLLRTDQRGKPRPDPEDTGGCDIGAYESQID